ncbi:MAG: S9 family peptidase [Acidimicrobiales bacterium]
MTKIDPPLAERRPKTLEIHGDRRQDDWYWLRDRTDPDVFAYLEAENTYQETMLAHTTGLQEALFAEFKGRIQETDVSVPSPRGEWEYYSRTEEGEEYGYACRRPRGGGTEQILIDQNAMAEGHDYFSLRNYDISPDNNLMAYATNTDGTDLADISIRDLTTGDDLPDRIVGVSDDLAWSSDNQTLYYARLDETLRSFEVWRHRLGTDPATDERIFHEPDERFNVGVERERDGRLVIISVRSSTTSEVWIVDATDPSAMPVIVQPRREGLDYSVTSQGDRLLIVTNLDAVDFRLMATPTASPGIDHWTEVIPAEAGVRLRSVYAFAGHVAIFERGGGVRRIRILDVSNGEIHAIDQDDEVSSAGPSSNLEYDTTSLRYTYTSMVTPASVFEYDMDTRERTLLKQQPVLGDFDPSHYRTFRDWATAEDGTRIPISVVARADVEPSPDNPCVLYGYGSYENSVDPNFSAFRLSLIDRGVIFAIAHPRGGGEMGRRWYEDGKFLKKRNTFTDFIACADHLVAEGWTSSSRLVGHGGSAGGLLVGAVVNLRPDLFHAVVADVPFVDVVTTMLDESIPLTVGEFEEWGNPKDPEYYAYMKSYSPYDNVEAKDYPALFVTTGVNDTRVAYWEPAKWVAKLRTTKTDNNLLVLKTEMGAGHGGPSGRYSSWRDLAHTYAFILDQLGLTPGFS